MLCPNCKQQLMNVNGRYICVDCGTEVPENEIPVAQTEFDDSQAKVSGNDYLYTELGQTQPTSEPSPQTETEPPLPVATETPIEKVEASADTQVSPELPVSQLINPEPIEPVVAEPPQEAPVEEKEEVLQPVEVPTPEQTISIEPEINVEPVAETPVEVVDVPTVESVPEQPIVNEVEEAIDSENNQFVPPVEPEIAQVDVEGNKNTDLNINSENLPVENTQPTSPQVESFSNSDSDTVQPTEPAVSNFVPAASFMDIKPNPQTVDNMQAPVQTISQAPALDQMVPVPVSEPVAPPVQPTELTPVPELLIPAQIPNEETVAPQIPEYSFSQAEAPVQDKTVYQNPIYDVQDVQESPDEEAIQFAAAQVIRKRRIIIFSALGGLGVLVLLIGGFFVYSVLTKPANVQTANLNSVIDCGSSGQGIEGSDEAKACFEENFKACNLATYKSTVDLGTQGGIVTYAYEITGKTDNSCTIEEKFTQNPNTAWVNKKMVCELDNSLSFQEASNNNSAENCTGPLADLMFGTEEENANPAD